LVGGVWGIGKLVYKPNIASDNRETPVQLEDLMPFQVTSIDLDFFKEARYEFSLNEWIDFLFQTIGYNPQSYSFDQKVLIITRLLLLIENNLYLVELGPKGTGKTSLFRNISQYVRLVSGGTVTPPLLFYNIGRKLLGLLGLKDLIVFDEISKMTLRSGDEIVAKLKDYMSTGSFERGEKEFKSTASLAFIGNIKIEIDRPLIENYFSVFPKEMRDTAFIDRINGFLPGWKIPKIGREEKYLAQGYGLVTDYFAEVLHLLREETFITKDEDIGRSDSWTIRDEKSIRRLLDGFLKLIFPNGEWDRSEYTLFLNYAKNYRQIIVDQLNLLDPGEFKKRKL